MSLLSWVRGWAAVDAAASQPSRFDRLLAETEEKQTPPGGQRFIPADAMTDDDWQLARFSNPRPEATPSIFSPQGNPQSFPMPR